MPVTRLGNYGAARSRYGLFSGKAAPSHPVGRLTRHGNYGGARRLYGPFSGKTAETPSAHPVAHITRLANYGGPRRLYGSFAGKTLSVVTPTTLRKHEGFRQNVGKMMR